MFLHEDGGFNNIITLLVDLLTISHDLYNTDNNNKKKEPSGSGTCL